MLIVCCHPYPLLLYIPEKYYIYLTWKARASPAIIIIKGASASGMEFRASVGDEFWMDANKRRSWRTQGRMASSGMVFLKGEPAVEVVANGRQPVIYHPRPPIRPWCLDYFKRDTLSGLSTRIMNKW